MRPPLVTAADLALIAVLAVAVGVALAASLGARESGETARIMVAGESLHELALDRDEAVTVEGPLGESRIEIRDGQARFASAPCPRRLCLQRGWIHSAGDSVSCLPNRVHLEITGNEREYDSIHY